jgi:two-component system sensor histidine kinase/response regulator
MRYYGMDKQNLIGPEKNIPINPARKIQSPWHLLKIVAITIFIAEVAVSFLISLLPNLSLINSILIDAFLLSFILFPILYFFLYRPMALSFNERKVAIQEEERQKKFFEQTFIQSSTSTQILDKEGWCLRINPKLSELFGVQPEQMEGHVYNIFNDEEIKRNGIDIIFKRVFNELKVEQWEINFDIGVAAESQDISVKEKKKLWLYNKAYPIVDFDGNLINVVVQHEDITERKMSESILRESEERFRELFNDAPLGYHELDMEGRIVRVNKTELEMLGYSMEEMLGKYVWKFYVDEEISRLAVLAKIAHNTVEKNLERMIRRKDGTTFPVLIEQLLLYDLNGICKGIRTAIQDITERKKNENEIQRINSEMVELLATKDRFFSIIAHDLRSPFNGILGFSEILKEEARDLDVSTIEQYAGMINFSSRQVLNLLENLLEWARLQRGQMPFNPSSIVLKEVANETIDLLKENANLKEISLFNHIPDDLIVHADENMIKALIRNLLSNAIKFTSSKGKVELFAVANTSENNGHVEVSVLDNGMGINKENIKKLFNIGTNYAARGTKNEKGTGLGLILCKEFVEKHGGRIWVESDADPQSENKGSTFKFTLPTATQKPV